MTHAILPEYTLVAGAGACDPAAVRHYHLVVDGTDNFPTRYVLSDAAAELGIPVVWGSLLRAEAQVIGRGQEPPPLRHVTGGIGPRGRQLERLVGEADRVTLAAALRSEGDVVADTQVREERIALEDGVDRALVGT